MSNLEYYISLNLFICSLIMLCFYFKHLLCLIISLEFIMVMLFMNMYIVMLNIESSMYILMYFLIMSVCEGALSLSLIVLMVRYYGNDYINSLSFLKW